MLREGRARLTQNQREQIVEGMLTGQTAAAVARHVGCDYRTVRRWWARWLEEQPLQDRRGRRGRPRETTAEDDTRIMQYAEERVFCTAGEIREALGLHCSKEAIRR